MDKESFFGGRAQSECSVLISIGSLEGPYTRRGGREDPAKIARANSPERTTFLREFHFDRRRLRLRSSAVRRAVALVSHHMSAHSNSSGPRSNRYSGDRCTNWSEYKPWWLEVQAVLKRFDGKIAKRPLFLKIIELHPLDGFIRPCSAHEAEAQLESCSPEFMKGLRAVFILSGTTKQLKSWGRATTFYGHYWKSCVFLHAYPFGRVELVSLRRFYLRDVLMHEIGHHLDSKNLSRADREQFAEQFAKPHG